MKKILSILMFVTLSFAAIGPINANAISSDAVTSAGYGSLNAVDQAEVLKLVAEKAQAQAQKNGAGIDINGLAKTSPEKVNQWVEVGSNIGKGLVGASKELGVEVNNFASTPMGQLTVWLIIWHIMGATLVHFFGAFIVWIVGFIGIWFIRNKVLNKDESLSSDAKSFMSIMVIAVFVAGIIVMFTF